MDRSMKDNKKKKRNKIKGSEGTGKAKSVTVDDLLLDMGNK